MNSKMLSKKYIIGFALIIIAAFMLYMPLKVRAVNQDVTIESTSLSGTSVTVKGTTSAVAVAVQVRDSSNTVRAMGTAGVKADNSFTATISGIALPSGDYKIYVADFEGGNWSVVEAKVVAGEGAIDAFAGSGYQDGRGEAVPDLKKYIAGISSGFGDGENKTTGPLLETWEEINSYIVSNLKVPADKKADENYLIMLDMRLKNRTMPAETLKAVQTANAYGLHIFTGNGTALTFINDKNLTNQKAVNIGCETTTQTGKKTLKFTSTDKLVATTILHAVVPKEVKLVKVYFTGQDKTRKFLLNVAPNEKGQLCFPINELGTYELEY